MPEISVKRGAIPSTKQEIASASRFTRLIGAPQNAITIPNQISFWGNDVHGDCVTAEEAFAKACNNPEIFIPENDVIAWATRHNVLEGASLVQVLQFMQNDGFAEGTNIYNDGGFLSVDFTNQSTLQSAISSGPVKIGIAADQIEVAWNSTGGNSGWFATGFHNDAAEDHCVTLCGYGSLSWLAQRLNVAVPAGIDGNKQGYALFTWNSIGIIDHASMAAITQEAWLRRPTTVVKSTAPTDGSVVEQHNLFLSADGHIHALWFNFSSGWHQEDRTLIQPGTPSASGNVACYAFVNKPTNLLEQHNLFRSGDGHIHALWFNFATGWHHEDRTAMIAGTPPAVGDPFGYAFVNDATGVVEQHNLFRSADGHIHALWFNFATGWHHEDRTAMIAGTPPAVGDPFGYAFVNNATGLVEQHNLFRSADGHIHALWFNFATGWHHEDRTAIIAGTPAAVGDPFGYAFVNNATGVVEQHNLFRSGDGHIHALWFNFATGWHHEDRTAMIAGTPPAVGDPFGYTFVNNATGVVEQHNLFRSGDGHIHALWFNFATGWHHEDRTAMIAGTPPAVGDPFGYAFVNNATGVVEQHNLFRSADGHIHALWFNFATGWHHEDRTATIAGTPPSVGDPVGYAFIDSSMGL